MDLKDLLAAEALQEQDIEICQRDGEPDVLGSGGFGKVEHVLAARPS